MSKKLVRKVTVENCSTIILQIGSEIQKGLAAGPVVVELKREGRSLDQNAKMWPMLADISKQAEHHGMRFSPDDWKDICSAGFEEQRLVPGIDGKFVALGSRTSKFNKEKFSQFIEYLYWWGQEKEVQWSEKALAIYEQYGEFNAAET